MKRIALALWIVAALLAASAAGAHELGMSRGRYQIAGATVAAEITFAERELAELEPGLDHDGNGTVTEAELASSRDALGGIARGVTVTGDGAACAPELASAHRTDGDGVVLKVDYHCTAAPTLVAVRFVLFERLAPGHRHLAALSATTESSPTPLSKSDPSLRLQLDRPAAPPPRSFSAMVLLGSEHIAIGYDHLLFLLGLVLIGGTARSLFATVTAFTVGHSVSLAIAALGLWTPSPSLVEPAIALSIAYIGVENYFVGKPGGHWLVKEPEKRWRITLPFGLVHGFGFAGALHELGLGPAEAAKALLGFNLGVEAGQLAALAVVLPLVLFARKKSELARTRGLQAASAAIAAVGLVLFVARVVDVARAAIL